jgi:hypothetical protein
MSAYENLYDWIDDQNCGPQPENELDEALRLVYEADQRVKRGQELSRILWATFKMQGIRL